MSFEFQEPFEPKPPDRKKPLSLDEVMETVSKIAQDPDNRDQFKALKMLASAQNAAIVLPEPLAGSEMVDRVGRLMKGIGIDLTHVAYSRAFPSARGDVSDTPTLHAQDIPPEILAEVHKVRSLKRLYRVFPEISRPGWPPGYPAKGSLLAKQEWVQRAATRMLLDREQKKAAAASKDRAQARETIVGPTP